MQRYQSGAGGGADGGDFYAPHYDSTSGRQRVATVVLYLDGVDEGSGGAFPVPSLYLPCTFPVPSLYEGSGGASTCWLSPPCGDVELLARRGALTA